MLIQSALAQCAFSVDALNAHSMSSVDRPLESEYLARVIFEGCKIIGGFGRGQNGTIT